MYIKDKIKLNTIGIQNMPSSSEMKARKCRLSLYNEIILNADSNCALQKARNGPFI